MLFFVYAKYTLTYMIYKLQNEPKVRESSRILWGKLGSLGNDDGNENGKKTISLISKTTTLHVQHAFFYIPLPSLHDYDVKMPNFTYYGERKQATTNFSFSF